jgi:hypothetical protein
VRSVSPSLAPPDWTNGTKRLQESLTTKVVTCQKICYKTYMMQAGMAMVEGLTPWSLGRELVDDCMVAYAAIGVGSEERKEE